MDNRPLPPTPAFAGAPWLVIPNCLPPEFLTEVIDYAEQFAEKEVGRVGQALGQTDQKDKSHREDIRACDISWLHPFQDERGMAIHQQISSLLAGSAREYWGYDVFEGGTESIQYTEYNFKEEKEFKDHYGWHMDSMIQMPAQVDRKVSFSIQLTHESDYTGCDFEFPGVDDTNQAWDSKLVRAKGTAIIFPSFMFHRVTPITGGKRKALVGWIRGPRFK